MIGEKTFGGFDRSQWPARNNDHHRKICGKIAKCSTKAEKEAFEKKTWGPWLLSVRSRLL